MRRIIPTSGVSSSSGILLIYSSLTSITVKVLSLLKDRWLISLLITPTRWLKRVV
jgi:hypothetical protein